jgi:hypothetical protein
MVRYETAGDGTMTAESFDKIINKLEEWKNKSPNRWYSISRVNNEWQISLTEMMRQSDDWDADAWVIYKKANSVIAWHAVNDALRKWEEMGHADPSATT